MLIACFVNCFSARPSATPCSISTLSASTCCTAYQSICPFGNGTYISRRLANGSYNSSCPYKIIRLGSGTWVGNCTANYALAAIRDLVLSWRQGFCTRKLLLCWDSYALAEGYLLFFRASRNPFSANPHGSKQLRSLPVLRLHQVHCVPAGLLLCQRRVVPVRPDNPGLVVCAEFWRNKSLRRNLAAQHQHRPQSR